VRVAVEAAIRFGWDRWLYGERGKREKSGFVGMHGFGGSAPGRGSLRAFRHHRRGGRGEGKSLL
jgi:transketolase